LTSYNTALSYHPCFTTRYRILERRTLKPCSTTWIKTGCQYNRHQKWQSLTNLTKHMVYHTTLQSWPRIHINYDYLDLHKTEHKQPESVSKIRDYVQTLSFIILKPWNIFTISFVNTPTMYTALRTRIIQIALPIQRHQHLHCSLLPGHQHKIGDVAGSSFFDL